MLDLGKMGTLVLIPMLVCAALAFFATEDWEVACWVATAVAFFALFGAAMFANWQVTWVSIAAFVAAGALGMGLSVAKDTSVSGLCLFGLQSVLVMFLCAFAAARANRQFGDKKEPRLSQAAAAVPVIGTMLYGAVLLNRAWQGFRETAGWT